MTPRHLGSVYQPGQFGLSFEVFPPKTEQGDDALQQTMSRLKEYRPAFISCTYGAGGSTQARTMEICRSIQDDLGVTAMSHFTCVGSAKEQLIEWLDRASAVGIRNIMALRGDPPQGETEFRVAAGGLSHANELVSLIRERHPEMGIGVAGYPEKHQEAPSLEVDLLNLKRKVDAGANAVVTQLFYVNENFYRFRDACDAAGISVPIVAGIMPITEFARMKRITAMCGAVFPTDLASRLEAVQQDLQAQFDIGVEYAIQQCQDLVANGAPGIHFYVLNKSQACERILDAVALK